MTKEILLKMLPNGITFEVLEDCIFSVNTRDYTGDIIVPQGFITDFASIPQIAYSFVGGRIGKYSAPAIIHDYLYSRGGQVNDEVRLSRKDCDEIFYREMLESNVSKTKAYTMYRAVRTFGHKFYKG